VLRNNLFLETLCLGNNKLQTAGTNKIALALKTLHHLKILKFSDNQITKEAGDLIADVIVNNKGLEALFLDNNNLKNKGICSIMRALMQHNTMISLRLEGNNITGAIGSDIAKVISGNPLLNCIVLGHNNLGSEGMIKIANALKLLQGIKYLGLNDTNLEGDVAVHIAEVVCYNPGLKELWLNNNKLKTSGIKELCKGIKHHSSFMLLQLNSNEITEEAANDLASVLRSNKFLETLCLGNNKLQTAGINELAESLKSMLYLKVISLDNNQLSEQAATCLEEIIRANRNLKHIALHNNHLKSSVAMTIASAVKDHPSVGELSLFSMYVPRLEEDNIKQIIESSTNLKLCGETFMTSSICKQCYGEEEDISQKMGWRCAFLSSSDPIACVNVDFIAHASRLLLIKQTEVPLLMVKGGCKNLIATWAKDEQLNVLLENIGLFQNVITVAVRCSSDSQITESDVTAISFLVGKVRRMVSLDLGNTIAVPITLPDYWVLFDRDAYQNLNLLPTQILNVVVSLSTSDTIKHLNFSGNSITLNTAHMLASVLPRFTNISTLALENCDLQIENLHVLCSSLSSLSLSVLSVAGNNIASPIGDIISILTTSNSVLKELFLQENNLTSTRCIVSFSTLEELCIDKTIFLNVMNDLLNCRAQPNLKKIFMCDSKTKTKVIVLLLCPVIQKLDKVILRKGSCDIEKNMRMRAGLVLYATVGEMLISVEQVGVSWEKDTALKDTAIMTYCSTLTDCKELACHNCTNEVLTKLEVEFLVTIIDNNVNLQKINLSNYVTNVDTAFPEDSYITSKLNFWVDIRPINLSQEAFKKILFSLCSTINLTILNLSGNIINEEIAYVLSIAIANCTFLEQLLLKCCSLQTRCVVILCHSLAKITALKILDLSSNNLSEGVAQAMVAIINSNRKLEELHLDNNFLYSLGYLTAIWMALKNSQLSLLVIDVNLVRNSSVSEVADFASNVFTIKCLVLKNHKSKITGEIQLVQYMNKSTLSLTKQHSYSEYLIIFPNFIKENETMNILLWNNNYGLSESGVFNLIYAIMDVKCLHLHSRRYEYQSEEDVVAITNAITNFPDIEKIFLYCMTSDALLKIFRSLKNPNILNTIGINYSKIDNEVAVYLLELLTNNKIVHTIDLRHCSLASLDTIKKMAPLSTARHMKTLALTNNFITDEAANSIADVLLSNSGFIECFCVEENKLQANGLLKFLTSLEKCNCLMNLSICGISITKMVLQKLLNVIKKNPKLEVLDLEDICLSTDSAVEVLKALKSNSSLKVLDITENNINERVADFLAALIIKNPALEILHIGRTHLGSNGVSVIANGLTMLTRIKELEIINANITPDAAVNIANFIENNTQLESLYLGAGCVPSTTVR